MTPSVATKRSLRRPSTPLAIPRDTRDAIVDVDGREVRLTNLAKPFWPESGIAKGDLLQYYADVAAVLLPHLRERAMVRKRYPNGARGKCFFMKRAPSARPGMPTFVKTTGSKGVHVYVPIVRGPTQKQVWTFAKALAQTLAARNPKLLTAEYRVAKRPRGRVLVDYDQNAWGRTLASVYSPRPRARAPVSTPVSWKEVEKGIEIDDFRLDNVPARVRRLGDLWRPLNERRGRFDLRGVL